MILILQVYHGKIGLWARDQIYLWRHFFTKQYKYIQVALFHVENMKNKKKILKCVLKFLKIFQVSSIT